MFLSMFRLTSSPAQLHGRTERLRLFGARETFREELRGAFEVTLSEKRNVLARQPFLRRVPEIARVV
jgi:hypothetical protein